MPRVPHRQQRPAQRPGGLHRLSASAGAPTGTGGPQGLPLPLVQRRTPSRPPGHFGGKQRARQALRHGQEGKAPRTTERAQLRESLRIPHDLFSFGSCSASVRHLPLRPTTPPTHTHTRRGSSAALRRRARKQRAPLRTAGHRRSRTGPGCRGSSPSCQAERERPPGRAGPGRIRRGRPE